METPSRIDIITEKSNPLQVSQSDIAHFWSFVIKTDKCWIWKGFSDHVYPQFSFKKKQVRASRFAYEITYGKTPDGLFVCHKCDNHRCVRPDHLFLGTSQDNSDDMKRKGRQNGGLHLVNNSVEESNIRIALADLECEWEQFKKDFIEADKQELNPCGTFRYADQLMRLRRKTGWLFESPLINS